MNAPSSPAVAPPDVDEQVFLIGRPPMAEFCAHLEQEALEGQTLDRGQAGDIWRAANDHVKELERDEVGLADGVSVGPLPPELEELRGRALEDPVIRQSFAFVPVDVGIVELDRLVVFQKHINITYVRQLQQLVGPEPGSDELLRFCLPFDRRYDPEVTVRRVATNEWQVTSASIDLRPLDFVEVNPLSCGGLTVAGVPKVILGVAVGYGANYLTAVSVEGRLILKNGSHRAFALRDLGITHVPCLIERVSRVEELEMVGSGEMYEHRELYVNAARPPLLKDYFDEQLRMTVHVPRRGRQVRVQVSFAQLAA